MKKAFSVLILIGLLAVLVLPQITLAQLEEPAETCQVHSAVAGHDVCGGVGEGASVKVNEYPMCCLLGAIYRVTDWIFYFLVALVVVFVLMGGFNILTAGGATEKVTAGRNYILWAALGLVVALFAKAVPTIVKLVAGLN